MSTQEGYQTWLDRMHSGRDNAPMKANEVVKTSDPEPMIGIKFLGYKGRNYCSEVGRKGEDLVFHFFPTEEKKVFAPNFEEKMGDAFLLVYKFPDKISAAFAEELNSWAVLVKGYAANPLAEGLSSKLFLFLDNILDS